MLQRRKTEQNRKDLAKNKGRSVDLRNEVLHHRVRPTHRHSLRGQETNDAASSILESVGAGRPERTDSRSTVSSKTLPISSTVFVINALETIGTAKEVRRNKQFNDAVQAALANIKSQDEPVDPEVIFKPLQLATKSYALQLQVTALDCIGKLISYSYFAFPSVTVTQPDAQPQTAEASPLIERAIEAICDCFENEATPVEIQQQIVKSLLAAVLDDKIVFTAQVF